MADNPEAGRRGGKSRRIIDPDALRFEVKEWTDRQVTVTLVIETSDAEWHIAYSFVDLAELWGKVSDVMAKRIRYYTGKVD